MSILIKGMEMPKKCWRCCLSQLYENPREMLVCKVTHEEVLRYNIDSNCPLVPVPPHGRLIDADALQKRMIDYGWKHPDSTVHEFLEDDAPTIIEAEEGE